MAKFDSETLRELHDMREVAIRTEKHPGTSVIIWVVVADDEAFVRSVRGSKGRWYRDLAKGGAAKLEFAGRDSSGRGPADDIAAGTQLTRRTLPMYPGSLHEGKRETLR